MDWIEVRIITTTEGIEPVTGTLLSLGIQGMVIEDNKDLEKFLSGETAARWDYIDESVLAKKVEESSIKIYLADNQQGREQLDMLRQTLKQMKAEDKEEILGSLKTELTNVKEEDWANNWKAYFKPFEVGEKLVIKPTWEKWDKPGERIVLEIDPGSSFGTGQHHTTRLCLELLESTVKPGQKVLDLGCGSGILFIAALLLGAGHACAVDIEEHCVKVATENALQNKLATDKYCAFTGDITREEALRQKIGSGYDLVVANIVADVILAMSPFFKGFLKENGRLLISGIINDRKEEVMAAIEKAGFKVTESKEAGDWNAMLFELI